MIKVPPGPEPLRVRQSLILSQAAQGDERALSTLLESARPSVYRWAESRIDDPDDAEDVTQIVLLRLIRYLPRFRGDSTLSSWLYRITVREVAGLFRGRSRERDRLGAWSDEHAQMVSQPFDPERIDHQRAADFVVEAASSLPSLQQATFRLVDLGGLSPCEAATELGKAQANIRSSLCRARKRIRELVRVCHEGGVPSGSAPP